MGDDEVLCQSVEVVLRVAHNLSKPRIFIHLYSISSILLNHNLSSLVLSFDEKLSLLCIGNTTVGPSSLGF